MNIMEKLVPSVYGEPKTDEDVEEAPKARGVNSTGPFKTRSMSNGQIRRAILRQQATKARKQAIAFRKRWMDNRQNVAVLRGQLEVLAKGDSHATGAIERSLIQRFGSVQAAQDQYAAIVAEAQGGDKVEGA